MLLKQYILTTATALLLIFSNSVFGQTKKQLSETSEYSFSIYKQIHRHPELGKKEFKTAQLIKEELQKFGFTRFYEVEDLPTAIIAELDTKKKGPVIAFRAELDARPGHENTGLDYASEIDTVMHSCGHDAHAAILLGAAGLLNNMKKQLKGKIYFVFQPAEEIKGGADDIVNSGILKELGIESMYALHSTSGMDVGKISISPGYVMAGSNYFTIEIEGKSSHAATPFEGSNIPLLTSRVVERLANIPSVMMDISARPSVISPTYIETGKTSALNVLPSKSIIKGTIRAYEDIDAAPEGQPSIRELVTEQVQLLCSTQNATAKVDIRKGAPPTHNNTSLYERTMPSLSKTFSGIIDTTPYRGMFAEDFSYYTVDIPCLYFGLGIAKGDLGYANVHSEEFTIHPDAFAYGVELFCKLALL